MRGSISLRNIPKHALDIAHHLCEQTGLSMADLLRQAIVSGLLVEVTKFAPDRDGTLGGLEADYLARALRRHLSAAIDVLAAHGQLPYQAGMGQGERPQEEARHRPVPAEDVADAHVEQESSLFEHALGDDLELLGMGISIAGMGEHSSMLSRAPA